MTLIISHYNHMALTSANNISGFKYYDNNIYHNQHKQVGLQSVNNKNWLNKTILHLAIISKLYCKHNIPHTPSKVGVLESITFSHTPEEAMSVGLAKACVL